ncbi:hypothetical protein VTN77DRAFT_5259 [Rasamsonia byssochlamydoides]|uniref:uncharacterized protein n=1 Tax=Rasamsonia byssochlamydoides TaxID=89139 RepID=UPI0037429D71
MSEREDPLAYGRYPGYEESERGGTGDSSRGIIEDAFNLLRGKHHGHESHNQGQQSGQSGGYSAQQTPNPPFQEKPPKQDKLSSLLDKIQDVVSDIGSEVAQRIGNTLDPQAYAQSGADTHGQNRFGSFAPRRAGNDVKWYVDGFNYMYAVSKALEHARESIWILDWWLSPELYLRRPPAKNEQYRLDRMLQAAAQRGVKVNIIVYKEVTQALTLSSAHTKHHLEELHPNIAVFRHPDHLPDTEELKVSIEDSLQNLTLSTAGIATLSADALKGLYGMSDETILYWAHHEKLCLIDGKIAFMGGLDLCFGRWDTNQHAIADVHPGDLNEIVFPGQDYNNARVLDFQDVAHWEKNQLDRKVTSRMGWSDISVSLHGPVVEDLRRHFVERWNFIYDTKYYSRKDPRYYKLALHGRPSSSAGQPGNVLPEQRQQQQQQQPAHAHHAPNYPPPQSTGYPAHQSHEGPYLNPPPYNPAQYGSTPSQAPYFPPPPTQEYHHSQTRELEGGTYEYGDSERGLREETQRLKEGISGFGNALRSQLAGQVHHYQDRYLGGHGRHHSHGGAWCQIVRSCSKWSHGVPTEHSIADAYAAAIRDSQHFVYIENQFFITATSDEQKPVKNKIGAAIVERILRAARAGQKYKIIVVIPSVPAFAGDLRDDSSLGTRAIMKYQYNSINRGGYSIMELIAKEGYNPMDYIRFYNLRNYDRINVNRAMLQAEKASGVNYEDARKYHDVAEVGYGGYGPGAPAQAFETAAPYQQYQQAAQQVPARSSTTSRWDSVSECYMLGGEDIRNVPWDSDIPEIDAFVSEELYVHSKVLIADDRVVICGSANLNDRSQLGYHDSEIAVIIEDPTPVESVMDGKPWTASRFATSLRRQLFRKHLGLLKPQDYQRPDANCEPVGIPNEYDLDSPESQVVADPLSDTFQSLWNSRARTNTEVFRQVFHAVPDDNVRNWTAYKEFYEYYFRNADKAADRKEQGQNRPAKYEWGHVVRDDFPPGPEGVRQVKELLSKVKGTLVEMPLMFLIEEDIAKEGLTLNSFTEEIYT